MLVMTSAVMNMPIMCDNLHRVQTINDVAINLGVNIPEPIIHKQDRPYRGYSNNISVLLDNADWYIEEALKNYFGVNIAACTFNIDSDSIMKRKE